MNFKYENNFGKFLPRLAIVEPGVLIQNLLTELDQFDLTLVNLPSTTGMQIGGLVQCGCHGSGANLPPLEEIVQGINMKNI